jgi:hypothetical protein
MAQSSYKFKYMNENLNPILISKLHVECNDDFNLPFIRISMQIHDTVQNKRVVWAGIGK